MYEGEHRGEHEAWQEHSDRSLLEEVLHGVRATHREMGMIMADLTALKRATQGLLGAVSATHNALDDLAAKVEAGGSVTQADIDSVRDTLLGATADLNSAVSADDPGLVDQTPTVGGQSPPTDQAGEVQSGM